MYKFIFIAFAFISLGFSSTEECREDPDFYMSLAGVLGKGNRDKPSFIFLPCDTAVIQPNTVLTVSKNTYISFQDPKPENLIIVKGTLLIHGEPENRVKISSSADTLFFSQQAMNKPWKGIQVEESGSVIMKNTEVFGAEIPIQSQSEKVRIISSFFFGGKKLVLPDKTQHIIPSNKFIEEIDFEFYGSTVERSVEKEKSPDKEKFFFPIPEERPFFKSPWFLSAMGALLVSGGGILAWRIISNEPEPEKHVIEVDPGL